MLPRINVYNLVILDESGSMFPVKNKILDSFNGLSQTIRKAASSFKNQQHFVSFVSFNSGKISTHLDCLTVDQLQPVNPQKYIPYGCTPLYDAIGIAVTNLNRKLDPEAENHVLVTILTDGIENASREFDEAAINELIREYTKKQWTFTYVGTGHNIHRAACDIGISNHRYFDKTDEGIDKFFLNEAEVRMRYYKKINNKEAVTEEYYSS